MFVGSTFGKPVLYPECRSRVSGSRVFVANLEAQVATWSSKLSPHPKNANLRLNYQNRIPVHIPHHGLHNEPCRMPNGDFGFVSRGTCRKSQGYLES